MYCLDTSNLDPLFETPLEQVTDIYSKLHSFLPRNMISHFCKRSAQIKQYETVPLHYENSAEFKISSDRSDQSLVIGSPITPPYTNRLFTFGASVGDLIFNAESENHFTQSYLRVDSRDISI